MEWVISMYMNVYDAQGALPSSYLDCVRVCLRGTYNVMSHSKSL